MKTQIKSFFVACVISLIPTFLLWLPFIFKLQTFWKIPLSDNGMAVIVSNYDGPLYLAAAKTLYNKESIKLNYQFPLSAEYYTAHFPLFPLFIKAVAAVTNYPYAMLAVTLFSSILAIFFFNKFIGKYLDSKSALFLTLIFSFFPARWLIVRSVGSADPFFVASVIASLYYFKEKKYLWAGVWGAAAQMTKSPGILLFASYLIFLFVPYFKNKLSDIKKSWPILFIPFSLVLVFTFYYFAQGDFFAYFKSGDNIHLFFPPFQIFNYSAPWVGTFWLEEIIFIYLIGGLGVIRLFKLKYFEPAVFSAVFFISILFVSHRDLMRYILPIVPFLFLAFSDSLLKKEFKLVLLLIIIPTFLYSLSFISQNVMPIANWAPFL